VSLGQDNDTFICDIETGCMELQQVDGPWATEETANAQGGRAEWTLNDVQVQDQATWQASGIPSAGLYEIAVWYPDTPNPGNYPPTNSARYEIFHADGVETVILDQAQNTVQWNVLATVPCPSDDTCRVKLTDATSEDYRTRRVWIDAVRFRRVSEDVPPLNLETEVSPAIAAVGETLTFTTTVSAIVTDQAEVTITLPAATTLKPGSLSEDVTYDAPTRQIRLDKPVGSGETLTITYQAEIDALAADGSILQSSVALRSTNDTQYRTTAVVIRDSDISGTAVITSTVVSAIVAVDNDLATEGLNLFYRMQQGADNPDVVALVWLDGPGQDDSYLYRVKPIAQPDCPSFEDPTCGYREGVDVWKMPEQVANPYSIASFLEGVILAYPNAKHIMPVFVGHGSGISAGGLAGQPSRKKRQTDPVAGILLDEYPAGTSLSTRSLGQSLRWSLEEAQAAGSTRERFDGVFLDACLMGMVEVAYELRDTTDYLLSSQSVKWTTFPYDEHLGSISDEQTAREIMEMWLTTEQSELAGDEAHPYTYALVDSAQLATLRERIDALADELIRLLPEQRDQITGAFAEVDCFDSDGDGSISGSNDTYCDLSSLSQALERTFSTDADLITATQQVQNVLSTTVILEDWQSGHPWLYPEFAWNWNRLGGLSIYAPLAHDEWKRGLYTAEHFHIAQDGQWDAFLEQYWNTSPPEPPVCPPDCGAPQKILQQQPDKIFLPIILR
jgi:hypothetical protein